MRVVFMGTPDFALPALERLMESSHEVVGVVTQPDRPKGRGREITPPPVKVRAEAAGIPVFQPEKLKREQFHQTLSDLKPDAAVVVAYGKILPKEVLDIPRHGCFNIHASLLPKYRGAAPIQRAIADGIEETGVTIMKLDEGMDTGPIIQAEEVPILDDDDQVSLGNMLSVLGAALMLDTLDHLETNGSVPLTPQDDSQATYAPPIQKEDARIHWPQTNEKILCLIRALIAWPVAFTTFKGKEWKILKAEPFTTPEGDAIIPGKEIEYGEVFALVKNRGFAVRTGDASVLVRKVQLPGKKPMDAGALLNGRLLKEGDVLGT